MAIVRNIACKQSLKSESLLFAIKKSLLLRYLSKVFDLLSLKLLLDKRHACGLSITTLREKLN